MAISVVNPANPSPMAALKPEVMNVIESVTKRLWNIPVMPVMETGATDGLFLRNAGIPVYGVGGSWGVVPDDLRAHGRDERLPVKALDDGVEHWRILVRELAGK